MGRAVRPSVSPPVNNLHFLLLVLQFSTDRFETCLIFIESLFFCCSQSNDVYGYKVDVCLLFTESLDVCLLLIFVCLQRGLMFVCLFTERIDVCLLFTERIDVPAGEETNRYIP